MATRTDIKVSHKELVTTISTEINIVVYCMKHNRPMHQLKIDGPASGTEDYYQCSECKNNIQICIRGNMQ